MLGERLASGERLFVPSENDLLDLRAQRPYRATASSVPGNSQELSFKLRGVQAIRAWNFEAQNEVAGG